MSRANIWSGIEWVSMTGGAGEGDEGGGTPDDDYLRLDGANNPVSPNNYLRTVDADLLYLPLAGGVMQGDILMDNHQLYGLAQISDNSDASVYPDGSINAAVSESMPAGLATTLTFRANEIRVAQINITKDGTSLQIRGIDGNGPTWNTCTPIATHSHVENNFAPLVHNHDGVYLPMSGGILTGSLGVSGGGTYIDANAIEIGSGQGSGGQSYIDFHANDDSQPDRMGRILVNESQMIISMRGHGSLTLDLAQGKTYVDHTFGANTILLGTGADTDGQVIMSTRIGRNWSLRQRGSGAGAHLELMSESNKSFIFGSDDAGLGDYFIIGPGGTENHIPSELGGRYVRNIYYGSSTPSGSIKGDLWVQS